MGYDTHRPAGDMPQHILDTFPTILRNLILANPDTPGRSVVALSSEHLGKLTSFSLWGKDSEQAALNSCLHNFVRKRVERGPSSPPSIVGRVHDPRRAGRPVDMHAERFTCLGVGPDKAVCMLFKSKCAIVAVLGIVKAGGCFVPLDPVLPTQRLQYLLTESAQQLPFNAYWFDVMLLDVFGALVHGACVCIPSEEQGIDDLASCVENFYANTTTLSTSVSRLIEPSMVPSLTTICLGGEPVLSSDADRRVCIIAVAGDLTPDTHENLIGEAVGCCVWVVNPLKKTERAPRGAVGELYIEGPNLARGYLGGDTKTAAAFTVDPPWMPAEGPDFSKKTPRRAYKIGDLVFFNSDGSLSYFGRRDTPQVKLRGQRVELAEIGNAIRRQLCVSVLIAVDAFTHEERGGRQVLGAAFGMGSTVENADGMQELVRRLRPALADVLPARMIPEVCISMPKPPALSTG
ncbi:hypothetical protein VTI74DRAFT_4081 [Chaetomium olivicolor]